MTAFAVFTVRDAALWQKVQDNNQNEYGGIILKYAARWANLMEREMANGERLPDIAEATSHDANTERISGFMYGCAVSTLAAVWEHGEALRRWHNKDVQIENEGDRANESGGVLNPAVLTIG